MSTNYAEKHLDEMRHKFLDELVQGATNPPRGRLHRSTRAMYAKVTKIKTYLEDSSSSERPQLTNYMVYLLTWRELFTVACPFENKALIHEFIDMFDGIQQPQVADGKRSPADMVADIVAEIGIHNCAFLQATSPATSAHSVETSPGHSLALIGSTASASPAGTSFTQGLPTRSIAHTLLLDTIKSLLPSYLENRALSDSLSNLLLETPKDDKMQYSFSPGWNISIRTEIDLENSMPSTSICGLAINLLGHVHASVIDARATAIALMINSYIEVSEPWNVMTVSILADCIILCLQKRLFPMSSSGTRFSMFMLAIYSLFAAILHNFPHVFRDKSANTACVKSGLEFYINVHFGFPILPVPANYKERFLARGIAWESGNRLFVSQPGCGWVTIITQRASGSVRSIVFVPKRQFKLHPTHTSDNPKYWLKESTEYEEEIFSGGNDPKAVRDWWESMIPRLYRNR